MHTRPLLLAILSAAVLSACASYEDLAPKASLTEADRLATGNFVGGALGTDAP